jgi:hypothetical protein
LKFHQLRPGTRFRFGDKTYRKISPLRASDDSDGSQRMIARSAEVTVLDDSGRDIKALPELLGRTSVESAITQLGRRLLTALDQVDPALQPLQRAALRQAVEVATDDALNQLMNAAQGRQ